MRPFGRRMPLAGGIAADEDRDSGNYSRWWAMRNYLEGGRPVQGIGVSGTWSGGLECQADTLRQSLCRHGIQRDPL